MLNRGYVGALCTLIAAAALLQCRRSHCYRCTVPSHSHRHESLIVAAATHSEAANRHESPTDTWPASFGVLCGWSSLALLSYHTCTHVAASRGNYSQYRIQAKMSMARWPRTRVRPCFPSPSRRPVGEQRGHRVLRPSPLPCPPRKKYEGANPKGNRRMWHRSGVTDAMPACI